VVDEGGHRLGGRSSSQPERCAWLERPARSWPLGMWKFPRLTSLVTTGSWERRRQRGLGVRLPGLGPEAAQRQDPPRLSERARLKDGSTGIPRPSALRGGGLPRRDTYCICAFKCFKSTRKRRQICRNCVSSRPPASSFCEMVFSRPQPLESPVTVDSLPDVLWVLCKEVS